MITELTIRDIEIKLKERLSHRTFAHSVRTRDIALDLANCHGVDSSIAAVAAMLHDYAKDMSDDDILNRGRALDLVEHRIEENIPFLLHARLGASLVEKELGIRDSRILAAISKHTYGSSVMTDLDRIVYLADAIEPGRGDEGLGDIRQAAETDLSVAFKMLYRRQLQFLLKAGRMIHPASIDVWNALNGDRHNG